MELEAVVNDWLSLHELDESSFWCWRSVIGVVGEVGGVEEGVICISPQVTPGEEVAEHSIKRIKGSEMKEDRFAL